MKCNTQEARTVTQPVCWHLKLTTPVPRYFKHDWQQFLPKHAALNISSHSAGGAEINVQPVCWVALSVCMLFTEINLQMWVLWRGIDIVIAALRKSARRVSAIVQLLSHTVEAWEDSWLFPPIIGYRGHNKAANSPEKNSNRWKTISLHQ